ncbi:hypothetical protein PR048_026160 [Dryococelus australis]|uniref:Uncharacterized protein n=1 Tax=Dryococelus australis TaxID=614101 RepID=A0ABQ9GKK3_9NEOP|nr:hypothetical protein PR048_026160 [Dryococelus australis]
MGCTKHFCLVARIVKDCTVSDTFLGLIPVQDASADSLYRHMTTTLTEADIPYKDNIMGFSCDGANYMAKDVYNYFQCSPKCIGSLAEFQELFLCETS